MKAGKGKRLIVHLIITTAIHYSSSIMMQFPISPITTATTAAVFVVLTMPLLLMTSSIESLRATNLTVEAFHPSKSRSHHHHHRSVSSSSLLLSSSPLNNNADTISIDSVITTATRDGCSTTTATRRDALERVLRKGVGGIITISMVAGTTPGRANAAVDDTTINNKQLNLSDEDAMSIIKRDLVENQFLVTGKLTRSLYDESCTFQDEIDTYGLEQWMKGTSNLFDKGRSKVVLVENTLQPMKKENDTANGNGNGNSGIEFRFVEYLCFNIPFIKPIVYLSGTLELKRNSTTGLITSYREKWDQDIFSVLRSAVLRSAVSSQTKAQLDTELDEFYKLNAFTN